MAQITVAPVVRASSARSAPSASAFAASRRAVGSSATITRGRTATARAKRPAPAGRRRGRSPAARHAPRGRARRAPPRRRRSRARAARARARRSRARRGTGRGRASARRTRAVCGEARRDPFGRARTARSVHEHVALVRELEPGEEVQQRRLPGAGRPRDDGERSGAERRVEPLDRSRRPEALRHPDRGDDRGRETLCCFNTISPRNGFTPRPEDCVGSTRTPPRARPRPTSRGARLARGFRSRPSAAVLGKAKPAAAADHDRAVAGGARRALLR